MQSSFSACPRMLRISVAPRLRLPGWQGLLLAGALAAGGGVATLAGVARPGVAEVALPPEPAPAVEAPHWRRVPLDPVPVALLGESDQAESAPREGRYQVGDAGTALRAAPSPEAATVAVLAGGTLVEAIVEGEDAGEWRAVRVGEQAGWVPAAALARVDEPER